jgi:23S rRNA pseudouridine2457 synthase
MTAAVGHPTLRLIRVQIGSLALGALSPGEKRTLSPADRERLFER